MQELLHAHWSVLATVCLICCCALLLNYAPFFSFDAEPVVEIKYWEESDSELQGDLHR